MNVGDERSKSFWMQDSRAIPAEPLREDAVADVVIIGAGMAGLSIAYELTRHGKNVLVIDRGGVGFGMTARTTAHLSSALDDYYHELIAKRGVDDARHYHESQIAAINRIEAIVEELGVACDFARVDGYLVAACEDDVAILESEIEACRRLDVEVEWARTVPHATATRALRFPRQGRLHPLKYLHGLASAITAGGGRLYSDTAFVSMREAEDGVRVETEHGRTVRAKAAIFATNSPVNDKVAIHTKQIPFRTYAVAGRVPKGSVSDILMWDTAEPYHYVRLHPLDDGTDLLIVGGEDHRTGEADDMSDRFAGLESWASERLSVFSSAEYRWSGQVLEPVDFMPFSGRNPGNDRVFIHSGDSGQGITSAVAGSLTILPLILEEDSRFAPIFDPGRVSVSAAGSFVKGVAGAVANLAEHLGPGEIDSTDDLEPDQGAIVRQGMNKVAAYRTRQGALMLHSAKCTHVGCVVHWNSFERCWDCPCHGSQFAPDGKVLNGPALTPLADVET